MYEDIKSIFSKIIGFFFWMWLITVVLAFTWGNYYGIKYTLEHPRVFHPAIGAGYFVLMLDDPNMKKFEPSSSVKNWK